MGVFSTSQKIRHLRGFTVTAKIVEHYLHQICTSFYNTPVNFSFDSPFSMDTLPTCFSKIKIDQPRLTVAADSIHFQVWLQGESKRMAVSTVAQRGIQLIFCFRGLMVSWDSLGQK